MPAVEFFDTHCHIHEAIAKPIHDHSVQSKWHAAGLTDPDRIREQATEAGVTRLLCVGTTVSDSGLAAAYTKDKPNVYASLGIHPHEASHSQDNPAEFTAFEALFGQPKVVAVGEIGLDYYYQHSPKKVQQKLLRYQLDLAITHKLPVIFHVRDAFADFWDILRDYPGVKGVVHSFTATRKELDEILAHNLLIGLNGIMTFTKNADQLAAAKAVPLTHLLLETDAPFLTPVPFRGKICEPKYVVETAKFLANLRGERLEDLAMATTHNALKLFNIT